MKLIKIFLIIVATAILSTQTLANDEMLRKIITNQQITISNLQKELAETKSAQQDIQGGLNNLTPVAKNAGYQQVEFNADKLEFDRSSRYIEFITIRNTDNRSCHERWAVSIFRTSTGQAEFYREALYRKIEGIEKSEVTDTDVTNYCTKYKLVFSGADTHHVQVLTGGGKVVMIRKIAG